jgi:gliding motility-associated-like protein
LPIEQTGLSYIISSYPGSDSNASQAMIVAANNNTEVIITPSAPTLEGNAAGVSFVLTLNEGDCYQIFASGNGDLTGTTISGTPQNGTCRKFAVFSGASCANVPVSCASACDHLYEQNLPLEKWGKQYVVTPPVFDPDPDYGISVPHYSYRILASQNATSISIDGIASFVLNAGQFQEYNGQTAPHCINASAPVCVIHFLEGVACGGNGDPSMTIIEPLEKASNAASFVVEDAGALVHHFLNIVLPATAMGGLLIDGLPVSGNDFTVIPACNNVVWYGEEIDPGAHSIECAGLEGFVAMLYGHGLENSGVSESYATSVGGSRYDPIPDLTDSFCSLNQIVIPIPENYINAQWSDASDPSAIISENDELTITAPEGNSVFLLTATSEFSGCVDTFYYSVESPAPFDLAISPQDFVICEHDDVLLTAEMPFDPTFYQFEWSASNQESIESLSSAALISPAANTTYNLTVTSLTGCSSASASTSVTVNEGGVAIFRLEDQYVEVCAGASFTPVVTAERKVWSDNFNPAISWGDWASILGGAEALTCGAISGNSLYFNGTFPREAITQPMDLTTGGHVYFSIKIANGTAPCDDAEPGDNVVLAYSVSNGPWTNIQTLFEASYPDFTQVVVPIPAGAMSTDVRLRWRQSGSYTVNQDNWVLDDMYVGVNETSTFNYAWSPNDGVDDVSVIEPIIDPVGSGWYAVEMNDATSGCVYMDSVYIELGEPFDVVLIPDTAVCNSTGVQLYVYPEEGGAYTYQWTPSTAMSGAQTAQPLVNPAVLTNYQVTVVSFNGCEFQGDVEVNPGVDFELTVSVDDETICDGEEINLTAIVPSSPGNLSFVWTGDVSLMNATSANATAMPLSNQTYNCAVTHVPSGCSMTSAIDVSVFPSFTLDPTPDIVTACSIIDIVVSASPSVNQNYSWQWSPAEMVTDAFSQTTAIASEQDGILTVTATSEAGCIASVEIPLSVNGPVTDLGEDINVCADEAVILNTGWPDNYDILWNTEETTPSITVAESGLYAVAVTDPNGCVSSDEIVVTIFEYPPLELGNDTSLCEGDLYTLVAGEPGLNYQWNTGSGGSSILISEAGVYDVEVDNGYCFTSDEITISYHPLPEQPFPAEMTYCFGIDPDGFLLDAGNQGASYLWENDSSVIRYVQVIQGGEYSVVVTTAQQCVSTFSTIISEVCPYSIYAPNSFTPDGDGVNDFWFVYGENITNYQLRLFNRMGELFYESNDITIPWLGQRRDGDMYVEPGVYDYQITFQVIDEDGYPGDAQVVTGFVILVR